MLSWVSTLWGGPAGPLPADPGAPLMFPPAPGLVLRSDDQLEYTPSATEPTVTKTYRSNRAMALDRVVLGTSAPNVFVSLFLTCSPLHPRFLCFPLHLAVTGIVLPYWECTVTLASPKAYVFMGFEVLGGFSMGGHESDGAFFTFSVGDTIGIGITGQRHVFFTRNGTLLEHANKKLIVPVAPSLVSDVPTMRFRGGVCVFRANFGDDAPFQFNPYSLMASMK